VVVVVVVLVVVVVVVMHRFSKDLVATSKFWRRGLT
jgi:hypothetical protein